MPWVRRRYRGNKVWIEADDAGAPVLDGRGLARLRYKPDDERTYSVRPSEVGPVDGPAGGAGRAGPDPGPGAPPDPEPAPSAGEGTEFAVGDDVPALAGLALHAYTDGASSGNPGPAGAGAVLIFREHRKEISRYLGETTNNVAELTAVLVALRAIRRSDLPVRLHSDSTYVIGVLDGSMKAKANPDLVAEIRAEMRRFADLRLVKVAGHAGVEENERADALARKAIRGRAKKPRGA
jgi:ribonuclease HI